MDMEAIKRIAAAEMENRSSHPWKEPGNKFYHGERVAKLALILRKRLFPQDDSHDQILTVAAWFHDVRNGEEEHWEKGAQAVRGLLCGLCTQEELDEICTIIALHDDRSEAHDGYSHYIKLHQDADHLDHFGSYDVWMNFAYGAVYDQTLEQLMEFMEKKRPSEDERYLRELNFPLSREIYREKADFLRQFSERFRAECSGEICNLDKILLNERHN